jgi:chloramphenicol-sensitive protein RarD
MKTGGLSNGIVCGIGAYALWGLFPLYWKLLRHISAFELIGHRIVWSFFFLMLFIVFKGQWHHFYSSINRRNCAIYLVASFLIGANWVMYVWAVNAGHVVETSLGYFINPLLNLLLGFFVFRERLRPGQWLSIAIAATGVIYLTVTFGRVPIIALFLALTFATYGVIKKLAPLSSVPGLTLEIGLLFIPAVLYLVSLSVGGVLSFAQVGMSSQLLMVGTGVVTTIPLLLFASAAKAVPLTILGMLQYLSPTIQFLIGIFVFEEDFNSTRLVGFSLVWLALLLFSIESYRGGQKSITAQAGTSLPIRR